MTPKIARTGSTPNPPQKKNMLESLQNLPKNDTKICHPQNRTLPNFKLPKMREACLPTEILTCVTFV